MIHKIAELTLTFDKDMMRNQLRAEIAEAKRMLKHKTPFRLADVVIVSKDRLERSYVEGYLNGMRMAIAMLDELEYEDGGDA